MSGVLIVNPVAHAAFPSVEGSGSSNLLTPDPKEIWMAASVNQIEMVVDLGAAVTIDSFFLGFTNAAPSATWSIGSRPTPGGTRTQYFFGSMRAADSIGPRHHLFQRLAQPVTARYFSLGLNQQGTVPLYAGSLVLGLAFEKHREYGAGRTIIDTGMRQDLPAGGFGMGDGVVKTSFAFSFVDLTDAERNRLFAIKMACGLRRPVLVVEDADLTAGRNEAIHYGVFERFQPYERVNPRNTRWAGSVVQWL